MFENKERTHDQRNMDLTYRLIKYAIWVGEYNYCFLRFRKPIDKDYDVIYHPIKKVLPLRELIKEYAYLIKGYKKHFKEEYLKLGEKLSICGYINVDECKTVDDVCRLCEELDRNYYYILMEYENLRIEYRRLLNKKYPKLKGDIIYGELKVGKGFYIDRILINKKQEEIRNKCYEEGTIGRELYERFIISNIKANEKPYRYGILIKTFIVEKNWIGLKFSDEMKDMCKEIGDGMVDRVICDLELEMRICLGETVKQLTQEPDKLPFSRVIELGNGKIGMFGGGTDNNKQEFDPKETVHSPALPPATIEEFKRGNEELFSTIGTPYAYEVIL